METIGIQYAFRLPDGRQEVFALRLDAESLELVNTVPDTLPDWAKLDCHQCPHCTLDISTHPYCPVASRLSDVVTQFANILSYDRVRVEVITAERAIWQDTSAQIGVGSLMGLIIAASGCPYMVFFRPMARFHLPFATDEETVCRSVSMFLLGQYFVRKAGGQPDMDLKRLKDIYRQVKLINACILDRLRIVAQKDSTLNAVITLDVFAQGIMFGIEDSLEDMRQVFAPYLTHFEPRDS
jgi:hypothetical protein